MGKHKEFLASLSEEQRKQVNRNSLEWYVYGIVVGVAAVLVWGIIGGL